MTESQITVESKETGERERKPTWRMVKTVLQNGTKQMRIERYQSKEQQSRFFREQEEGSQLWMTQNPLP